MASQPKQATPSTGLSSIISFPVLIFGFTLFVSAFLLFLIQPMIGKMILPNLGGTPQVWNTCMVFFQAALLAGYAYTHFVSTGFKLKAQLIIHGILLIVPFSLFLIDTFYAKINSAGTWIETVGQNPIPTTLWVLATVVGLPFFVVSTSAPLLQKWFGYTGDPSADDPYFLYGASNLGSMLSLFFYPVYTERFYTLTDQSWLWVYGYTGLVVLFFVCVGLVLKGPKTAELPAPKKEEEPEKEESEKVTTTEKEKPKETGVTAKPAAAGITKKKKKKSPIKSGIKKTKKGPIAAKPKTADTGPRLTPSISRPAEKYVEPPRDDNMTVMRRLYWVLLAFVPSSLMLGITTWISVDITAIAMFWVVPLALYLLTFIFVFSRGRMVWVWLWILFMIAAISYFSIFGGTLSWIFLLLGIGLAPVGIVYSSHLPKITWTGVPHSFACMIQPLVVAYFIYLLLAYQGQTHSIHAYRAISVSVLAFFLTTLVCHGQLASDRPSPKHLTEFYLWMSVGGFLGGLFNAIIAPIFFRWGLVELNVAVAMACIMRPLMGKLFLPHRIPAVGVGLFIGALVGYFWLSPELGTTWGIIFGILIAALFVGIAFTNESILGWSDQFLLFIFPEVGSWFDEKGKELKNPKPAGEEEPVKPSKISSKPDYYLLGYSFDILLPFLLAVIAYVLMINQEGISQWLFGLAGQTFKAENPSFAAGNWMRIICFGLPLMLALVFAMRPLRFGLAVMLLLLIHGSFIENIRDDRGEITLAKDRSYFGVLRVIWNKGEDGPEMIREGRTHTTKYDLPLNIPGNQIVEVEDTILGVDVNYKDEKFEPAPNTYLMHGTTHHGLNYQSPKKLRRLATTYYHRKGPVGIIMERLNWFPGPQHTYWADARLPCSIAAMGMSSPMASLPTQLTTLWSEPPYATIGLGTGTMASYARPFQHLTFYEIDNKIRKFSEYPFENRPDGVKAPYFNYVYDARKRGANVEIIMGDARFSLRSGFSDDKDKTQSTEQLREDLRQKRMEAANEKWLDTIYTEKEGGYNKGGFAIADVFQGRENYYRVIEVDAFSSDAIPIHLLTKEAVRSYFDHVTEDGVVMLHTSNRHVDLVPPALDILEEIRKEDKKLFEAGKIPKLYDYAALVVNCRGKQERQLTDKYGQVEDPDTRKTVGLKVTPGDKYHFGSGYRGHFQSEYVMVARDKKYLPAATKDEWIDNYHLRIPKNTPQKERYDAYLRAAVNSPYQIWDPQEAPGNRVWTDDYSNLLSVFRWGYH